MRQIVTTNNSVHLIDDDQITTAIYEKGDLCFKTTSNMLYCYNDADVKTAKELFAMTIPISINGTIYTDINDVIEEIDNLFKSTIDVETLESSIQVELNIQELMEEMKAAFDIVRANQNSSLANETTMIASLSSIDSKLNGIQTSLNSIDSKLTTVNSNLSTINTSVGTVNSTISSQTSILNQIATNTTP